MSNELKLAIYVALTIACLLLVSWGLWHQRFSNNQRMVTIGGRIKLVGIILAAIFAMLAGFAASSCE